MQANIGRPITHGARRFAARFRRNHGPEVTSGILIMGAIFVGITMVTSPDTYRVRSFRVALDWASPEAWGVAAVLTATAFAVTVVVARDVAWIGALGLTLVVVAWGAATLLAVPKGGVPSAAVVYSLIAYTCGWLTWLYADESTAADREARGEAQRAKIATETIHAHEL